MSHLSGEPASPGNPPRPTTPPPPPERPGGYAAQRAELERLKAVQPVVQLDTVYDSTNQYTALFSEEEKGEALERLASDVAGVTTPTERLTKLAGAFEQLCDSHVALWDGRIGSAAETHKRCVEGIGEVELALVREFMSVITGEKQ